MQVEFAQKNHIIWDHCRESIKLKPHKDSLNSLQSNPGWVESGSESSMKYFLFGQFFSHSRESVMMIGAQWMKIHTILFAIPAEHEAIRAEWQFCYIFDIMTINHVVWLKNAISGKTVSSYMPISREIMIKEKALTHIKGSPWWMVLFMVMTQVFILIVRK